MVSLCRLRRVGDPVQNALLLFRRRVGEILVGRLQRLSIQPHQTAENLSCQIQVAILLGSKRQPVVDVFRHARLARAAAVVVRRDNQIAQHVHRFPLMIVERLALIRTVGGRLRRHVRVTVRSFSRRRYCGQGRHCAKNLKYVATAQASFVLFIIRHDLVLIPSRSTSSLARQCNLKSASPAL